MNDFDWDAKQKKIIARSARHMASKRGKRGCTLPSDNLTEAQRRKLNGECRTYSLREPLTYEQFRDLPKDLQVEYMTWLRETFRPTDRRIADMFGVSKTLVQHIREELGLFSYYDKKGAKMPKDLVVAWADWLRAYEPNTKDEVSDPETWPQPIPEPEPGPEPEPELLPDPKPEMEKPVSRIETCRFTASGPAGDTAELLLSLFKGDPRLAHFTIEVSFD